VFNFSGSEMVFLLLLALIILGPEKLPDAVRKFGKGYAEFKKVTTGFQNELKSALDEPMREMRETADAFKKAATFDLQIDPNAPVSPAQAQNGTTTTTPASGAESPRNSATPHILPTSDAGIVTDSAQSAGTASPHGDDLGASAG
jgi:sec-independent protein translocase protein TatB